jgi:hypothetical protein
MDGVPEEIPYDRMKTVWIDIDDRGEIIWHPVFLGFAGYWGFTLVCVRPIELRPRVRWNPESSMCEGISFAAC